MATGFENRTYNLPGIATIVVVLVLLVVSGGKYAWERFHSEEEGTTSFSPGSTTDTVSKTTTAAASAPVVSSPVASANVCTLPSASEAKLLARIDELEKTTKTICTGKTETVYEKPQRPKPAVAHKKHRPTTTNVANVTPTPQPQVIIPPQPPTTALVVRPTYSAECAWIHPPVNYDQSATPFAGKRFDKPAGYPGSCKQFVDETSAKYGFPNNRMIQATR